MRESLTLRTIQSSVVGQDGLGRIPSAAAHETDVLWWLRPCCHRSPADPAAVSGRVAFVSGAASGIGRGVCYQLAQTGYRIVALDIDGAGLAETVQRVGSLGGEAVGWPVDIADALAVADAVARGVERFGRADALIHSAGYVDNRPFLDIGEPQWDRMIAVHLKGAYNSAHAVVPHMIENHYGRVVFVSSTSALSGSPHHCHYVTAKTALLGFTKGLSLDLARWGITVNAVLPGPIATPLLERMAPERLAQVAATPVGHIGTPEDVAHAVGYLISPEAGYCTGAWLRVSGGA